MTNKCRCSCHFFLRGLKVLTLSVKKPFIPSPNTYSSLNQRSATTVKFFCVCCVNILHALLIHKIYKGNEHFKINVLCINGI